MSLLQSVTVVERRNGRQTDGQTLIRTMVIIKMDRELIIDDFYDILLLINEIQYVTPYSTEEISRNKDTYIPAPPNDCIALSITLEAIVGTTTLIIAISGAAI